MPSSLEPVSHGSFLVGEPTSLNEHYQQLMASSEVAFSMPYSLQSKLGQGGQGTVFLANRKNTFEAQFPLALKFFSPEGFNTFADYRAEMSRLAKVMAIVANIQENHVMSVLNVNDIDGVFALEAEQVLGYDLRKLLTPSTLKVIEGAVSQERWKHINQVILTNAGIQSRIQPFVAISILRECLAGVGALHRRKVIHGDLKPSNVMIKMTGNCKIIDLGSAFHIASPPLRPTWTPRYAAVEVLQGKQHTFQADIASLGYIFFELLTGTYPFAGIDDHAELVDVKVRMWKRLPALLPPDVARNKMVLECLSRMITPNPLERFRTMEEVDMAPNGAQAIQNQHVKNDLSTDAPTEVRLLLKELNSVKGADLSSMVHNHHSTGELR